MPQDGNSWSARYKRLLSTGSLILKSTIFPECASRACHVSSSQPVADMPNPLPLSVCPSGWNDRKQPWLHYVPVKVDYGDLYDIMTFVRLLSYLPSAQLQLTPPLFLSCSSSLLLRTYSSEATVSTPARRSSRR